MNESEVRKTVNEKKEGKIQGCYGPSFLGPLEVWEVWVLDKDDEFQSRFVVSESGDKPIYYSQFQQFCAFANSRETHVRETAMLVESQLQDKVRSVESEMQDKVRLLERQLDATRMDQKFRLISLMAATVAFIGCISALIYLMIQGKEVTVAYVSLLGGIIASGATMFFGNWKMPILSST